MTHLTKILSLTLLVLSSGAHAETIKVSIPQLYAAPQSQWRLVHKEMSRQEYKNVYRYNRRVLLKSVSSYLEQQFVSIGVPKMGVELVGNAVGFAVSGAKVNLNESKTMALEVRDVTDEDRGVYLKLKLDW